MTTRPLILSIVLLALAACDSDSIAGPCEPAATVSPEDLRRRASVAVEDAAGCRVGAGGAIAGPWDYEFGPERDWEIVPTFLVLTSGSLEDGPQVRFGLGGSEPPAPGRYPVMDLRGADGTFGPLPARFRPDSVYSFTTNGAGQGYWFATGGEVVVERSDEGGVAGTFEATYLHGGGGRPITVRGRFHASLYERTGGYGQYSNPHGG